MKTGVLLINLGTPDAPTVPAVRRYLREFLADPFVIDLPWLTRKVLLHAVILPFRTKKTTHAYQQIWTEQGSPFLVNSKKFSAALRLALGDAFIVALGMRYGEPSIQSALIELKSKRCEKIIVLPLFPQYSRATTGSAIVALEKELKKINYNPQRQIFPAFYQETMYIQALTKSISEISTEFKPEHILFSYHGLPERQLTKLGCQLEKCDRKTQCFADCYRAQCFQTTSAVAESLQLPSNNFQTVFQSRLGKTPWLQPYTDLELPKLIARGVRRLLIVCPSFVVDCLETLEEINLRLRVQWRQLGGEDFVVVPCLNDNSDWVQGVATKFRMNSRNHVALR